MPSINDGVVNPEHRLATEIMSGASDYLTLVDTDWTPLFSILSKLPSPKAKNTQVLWTPDQQRPIHASLAASALSAAASVDVATGEGAYFQVGDHWFVAQTGETIEVSGVTADAVGVIRSVGAVAAASAASGGALMLLGMPIAQGANTPTYLAAEAASGFNYTQVFRTPLPFTGTMAEVKRYGSKGGAKDIANRLAQHLRSIESSLFFGARSYTSNDGSGHPKGSLGGIMSFADNQTAIGGALSVTGFRAATDNAFSVGSKKKAVFCGQAAAAGLINAFGRNFNANTGDRKRFGVRPDAFLLSPGGEVPVYIHADWHPLADVSGRTLSEYLFLVDLGSTRLRPLRPTNLEEDRQGPGEDKVVVEWLTETSLEVNVPAAHAVLSGITG